MTIDTHKIIASFLTAKSVFSAYGKTEPLWSVLTDPKFLAENMTGSAVAEFYESGVSCADWVMGLLSGHDLSIPRNDALDFGCGAGRLALGFAPRFRNVSGCDISDGHLDIAREAARARGVDNVRFVLTDFDLIGQFGTGSFDFINSIIVLQHMIPPLMKIYIDQFCRLLRAGGCAFFQLPTFHEGYRFDEGSLQQSIDYHGIQLHVLSTDDVRGIVTGNGCEIVEMIPFDCVGPGWESHGFLIGKPVQASATTCSRSASAPS